jgi:predicted esterase
LNKAGITFNQTLGGIISLSGWLLESSQIPGNNQANRQKPIFVGHGRQDQYVQFNFGILFYF